MTPQQSRAVDRVIRLRAGIEEAREQSDVAAYVAVRTKGVPVRELADTLGLTRQRVYQMVRHGEEILTRST